MYSPDSPRGSSPILRCNCRGIESSDPPNADYIVVGLLFFIRIQSFLAYFDYFFTTFFIWGAFAFTFTAQVMFLLAP